MMRILVTIPHFFRAAGLAGDGRTHGSTADDAARRVAKLRRTLTALHQHFSRPQCVIDIVGRTTIPANTLTAQSIDVVVCSTGDHHLLDRLRLPGYYEHHSTTADPLLLGFECHAVLRDRLGRYDYFAYLEDDLILHDPWFFRKLAWFNRQTGPDCLLQPNRYEVAVGAIVHKAYVDGDLAERVTRCYQDVRDASTLHAEVMGDRLTFRRTLNPHSGCFFLDARQMERWADTPHFLDRDTGFIGPLESAATLGILRTFKVYKPAPECAAFLEVEHAGSAFLQRIKPPKSGAE